MTIANSIVLADNAFGTIGSGLAVGDTTLTFTTGHGARFPAVASGQVLYACILDSTNILEEVKITAHTASADSATIVRAAGGTTAKVWTSGSRIEARASSEVLKRLQDEALKKTTLTTADSGATYTGSMTTTALGYVAGLVYALTAATTNSVGASTIALDGLSAITVKLDGGAALPVNSIPVNGLYAFDGTNFILLNPRSAGAQTLTDGATINWDASAGIVASVTLAGNRTMAAPTNMPVGTMVLHVIQDGSGSRTITWNSVFKWQSASAPTLTTSASKRDVFSFICDGTNLYGNAMLDVR